MKTLITMLSFALLPLASPAHANVRENGGFVVYTASEIVFWSPGNGIDGELRRNVSTLIQKYKEAGAVSAHTEQRWGLEGEVTVCVQLSSTEDSLRFNQELAELMKRGKGKTNLKPVAGCKAQDGEGSVEE